MRETQWMDWGTLDYRTAWQRQEALMQQVQQTHRDGAGRNYLLLVEHPHVYTLGRRGNEANIVHRTEQAEFIRVDRGGDITYHGPGQIVVYPVIRLESFGLGIREYVHGLEEVVISTIGTYGINGKRVPKAIGVWIDAGTPAERKICAIGVRCVHAVTMHGFALNVNTDLTFFDNIHPCGFTDKAVTSLEKETGVKQDMASVKRLIVQNFAETFGMEFIRTD
ncbi:MAG: lipoyl(octanoyl) transferase LipB [Bacteroidales bacterium]|jgi:lipoyl(octanoyl) transferase|nr:lipoyl(octanoyl) transferase LipB [Bacteroidales bacterium]